MRAFLKTYGPAIVSGVLLAISFPTWGLFPLTWLALVPLFYRAASVRPRSACLLFFLAGWVFNSILLQWLMTNVFWAGGWAFWGYQALSVLLAAFWGVAGLTWAWIRGRAPWLGGAVCLALLWIAMEYVHAHLFTGFGWGALAYAQGKDLPLLQWAALGGASLVSAILVLFNALVALAIVESGKLRIIRAVSALALIGISHLVGGLLLAPADYDSMPLKVGVIQTDFPLEMKWDWEYAEEMVRNAAEKSRILAERAALHRKPIDLFVWPEAAIMVDIADAPRTRQLVTSLTQDTGAALYTGAQRVNKETNGYPNSSYFINPAGEIVDYYDKVHLAPFGEYVPFAKYLPFMRSVVPAMGEVEHGKRLKTMAIGKRRFGPLICFEVLFTDLAEQLRNKGADFLVVITNLAWFGASNAIPQELELARLRAIETRLPLVHCANTGISGVFDPWGRFSPVNAGFSRSGRYIRYREDIDPQLLIMHRCADAFPLAAPGRRPIPYGPRAFPWLALGLTALLIAAAAVSPRQGKPGSG